MTTPPPSTPAIDGLDEAAQLTHSSKAADQPALHKSKAQQDPLSINDIKETAHATLLPKAIHKPQQRDAYIADNGVFELDPDASYDKIPDVKAYLVLLGSESYVPWGEDMETEAAKRRGVMELLKYRNAGQGLQGEYGPFPTDPAFKAAPWLPSTNFDKLSSADAYKYVAKCFPPQHPNLKVLNPLNGSLLRGNVRLPLSSRPDLASIQPDSPEYVFYIWILYDEDWHLLRLIGPSFALMDDDAREALDIEDEYCSLRDNSLPRKDKLCIIAQLNQNRKQLQWDDFSDLYDELG